MSKYDVFLEHLTIIQNAIKTSVCQVADKCFQRGIIAETVYQSIVHGTKTPEDKARELLIAVGDQIKTDEQLKQTGNNSRFDKFVNTLEEEPVYRSLVRSLRHTKSTQSSSGKASNKRHGRSDVDSVGTLQARK